MKIQTAEVSGTVVGNSSETREGASTADLTVRLDDGNTVQASVNGKIDYRPGRRAVLKATTSNFFGVRKHEFKYYLDEPAR
jgi:hypothetical protein